MKMALFQINASCFSHGPPKPYAVFWYVFLFMDVWRDVVACGVL